MIRSLLQLASQHDHSVRRPSFSKIVGQSELTKLKTSWKESVTVLHKFAEASDRIQSSINAISIASRRFRLFVAVIFPTV
jgi:hypothetical protein